MTASSPVRAEMLKAIPSLRAFAISLCGNVDGADDLVQETLVKAWGNIGSFTEGSNMAAWLFTILRNVFYSQYRKRRREVDDPDGHYASKLASAPDQHSHMEFMDLKAALQKLPADQREALIFGRGIRALLRGCSVNLRVCDRNHEKPCQSRAGPSCRITVYGSRRRI